MILTILTFAAGALCARLLPVRPRPLITLRLPAGWAPRSRPGASRLHRSSDITRIEP